MFGNVGRSMLTVFQCFTDGCTSAGGTPLLWHLWDVYGVVLVVGYVCVFIFVTFGIFNLILAIFVENTLQYARVSDQKRASKRHADHLNQAKKLFKLLTKLCSVMESSGSITFDERSSQKGLVRHVSKWMKCFGYGGADEEEKTEPSHLNMRVTRPSFEAALESESVIELFEQLDVSLTSRDNLFDILDADGNGYLAMSELADGIMRLRGPPDKGDVVSTVLMVRTLQKYVMRFEEAVLHNQQIMKKLLQGKDLETDEDELTGGEVFNVQFRQTFAAHHRDPLSHFPHMVSNSGRSSKFSGMSGMRSTVSNSRDSLTNASFSGLSWNSGGSAGQRGSIDSRGPS